MPRKTPERESRKPHQHTAGAVLTEFVAVFPLCLLLLIGFVEIARLITVKSYLRHAAEQTLLNMQVLPNLDRDDYAGVDQTEADLYSAAYTSAVQTATTNATRVLVAATATGHSVSLAETPVLTIPPSTELKLRKDAMLDQPLKVTLKANITPLFIRSATYTVETSVTGYRERKVIYKMPTAADGGDKIFIGGSQR